MAKVSEEEVMRFHQGGKIETHSKVPVKTKMDLATVYTPGVAKVCEAIVANPERVYELTIKKNTIAVFTDGSAVLGLGDLGPEAALPVMEGKAMLFKDLANVDAFPICIRGKTTDEIVAVAKAIAPTFAGFNLEDISAPRCFEIESRLQEEVDIPVFHDDQHGTAVVTLAALYNALRVTGKNIAEIKIVVSGAGAAGIACSKIFMSAGVKNIILCDRIGAIYQGRLEGMNDYKREIAQISNPNREKGSLPDVLKGADLFMGLSGPNLIGIEDLKNMSTEPIIFAMSNPIPEIDPEVAAPYVSVMATGRSDFPNQINNVLCFPGFFRGLLDARAKRVTEAMKLAAAKAIADLITPSELNSQYIIPDALDPQVAPAVAKAVYDVVKADQLALQTS
ncbi:MAG: NADP-dependent malic enzyme [Candidatus Caenarcaniphilales bacterium]|nr:NADP-dependent malic enzyme [Candidatus Caenarcaniphilales bacterium]